MQFTCRLRSDHFFHWKTFHQYLLCVHTQTIPERASMLSTFATALQCTSRAFPCLKSLEMMHSAWPFRIARRKPEKLVCVRYIYFYVRASSERASFSPKWKNIYRILREIKIKLEILFEKRRRLHQSMVRYPHASGFPSRKDSVVDRCAHTQHNIKTASEWMHVRTLPYFYVIANRPKTASSSRSIKYIEMYLLDHASNLSMRASAFSSTSNKAQDQVS